MRKRKGFIIMWLILLLAIVSLVFWYSEWQYVLPTPVPAGYHPVTQGTSVDEIKRFPGDRSKPYFLHFFNPDCPCSRFNMKHIRELISQYGDQTNFIVILMTAKDYSEKEIQSKYDLKVPVLKDNTIAEACGVYSTPQAAIIAANGSLYYRGNYNRTRYCTDKKSNYAELALEQLLNKKPLLNLNKLAFRAYGCQLPDCNN